MTDFTILGFHMYGPKSGYDIKRFMGMSTAHFYQAPPSASASSTTPSSNPGSSGSKRSYRDDAPKASIRYFTGTGNSKRVADICAAALAEGGYATDVGAITAGGPSDGDAACFVFPVYSLDLPRIAKRYLEALPPTAGSVPAPPSS